MRAADGWIGVIFRTSIASVLSCLSTVSSFSRGRARLGLTLEQVRALEREIRIELA
jgi:hypothetical protein